MNPGDLFEFFNWHGKYSQPCDEFYDETLKRLIPVNNNTFIHVALEKHDKWNDQYDHSLYFTDGTRLFHTRVGCLRGYVFIRGGYNVSSPHTLT